ncbi:MAG: urea carboxylase-associated family protein [Deltaproteobacteria bacterium]|nr:urea carboxylase-associated family protein [Deltaproteobacteria bacterium]
MKKIKEQTVPYNTGWVAEMKKGQILRIAGTTTVDFVAFDLRNLRERFDQARTKVYNMKIFISVGDKLMSRSNQHLMTIVEDTYAGGTHDLQKGMCSGYRFQLAKREGRLREYYHRDFKDEEIPDHGCWENLSRTLQPFGIAPEDIPSPLNLYQTMKIDGATGRMEHTTIRPKPGTYVDLRAERDLLVAFSACPDLPVGGKPVQATIFEP